MSRSKRWLAVFSLWFLCCIDAFAQIPRPVIRVPEEYATIQSAINAAGINSTVLVAPESRSVSSTSSTLGSPWIAESFVRVQTGVR